MADIAAYFHHIWQAVQFFFENVDINSVIHRHGSWFYLITFVWAFLEGETFVIFAGTAAARGSINIYYLIFWAWMGSFCGDQLYYILGRKFGKHLLHRFPKLEHSVDKVSKLILKHDVAFILSYRFIYGLRNIASVCIGISGLPWRKFAMWNFLAAFIWANAFAWSGYLFGEVLGKVLGETIQDVMIGAVALLVAVLLIKYIIKMINKKKNPLR